MVVLAGEAVEVGRRKRRERGEEVGWNIGMACTTTYGGIHLHRVHKMPANFDGRSLGDELMAIST